MKEKIRSYGRVLKFKFILNRIGIILIACNVPFFIPLPLGSIFWALYVFQHTIRLYTLLLTITAGLVLYIIGRKEFSNYVKDIKFVSGLLTFSGFIIMCLSAWFLSQAFMLMGSEWAGPRTSRELAIYLLSSAWGGLGFVSGLLWLIDGGKTREDRTVALKKEIDFEEAWILEWHIHKKMREGKTREQAIEELTEESGQSKLS